MSARNAKPYTFKRKANKYGAKKTYSDMIGRHFDSAGECSCAETLWLRQKAGDISDLKFQPKVDLLGFVRMRPDFRYVEDGETIWHEFKGFATDRWFLCKKLWGQFGPGEYRVSYARRPMEIIRPRMSELVAKQCMEQMVRWHKDLLREARQ